MRFAPVGDRGLLVELAAKFSDDVNRRVVALDDALGQASIPGVCETVPAFVNVLVVFDPLRTDHATVRDAIEALAVDTAAVGEPNRHHVAVNYVDAPDLDAVAAATDLSVDDVIEHHLAGSYRVVMYGFAPGYAYLSGVPEAIQVPRKPQPVRDVPAGSLIIAGSQCLITTITMPTGWSVIGRTRFQVLPARPDEPFAFRPGDEILFERINDVDDDGDDE